MPLQVQTIGFLSHLYAKGIKGPFMVVAPLSTLGNWVAEFKRWAPSIPVCMYHGSKADRAALRAQHLGRGGWLQLQIYRMLHAATSSQTGMAWQEHAAVVAVGSVSGTSVYVVPSCDCHSRNLC